MKIVEMFYSVQGEGKFVGVPQIFIRFPSCNLNCRYCDTNFDDYQQISTETVIKQIKSMLKNPVHSISFTGGEPLLHCHDIQTISHTFSTQKIFLETNGTLTTHLQQIIDDVDIISMDFKLPSMIGQDIFSQHKQFLQVARFKDCYVKIVVTGETTDEEFLQAVQIISDVDPKIMLIIQPVDPIKSVQAVQSDRLMQLQIEALRHLSDVRIIPQTHKILRLQ